MKKGYVTKDDLLKITTIDNYSEDLFLEEICSSTYDFSIVNTYGSKIRLWQIYYCKINIII